MQLNYSYPFIIQHYRVLAVLLIAALILPLFVWPTRASAATVVYLTSGTSWTVPADWNDEANTIEVIGGGGAGRQTFNTGGGGGGYSKEVNVSLARGSSISYAVGAGGSSDGATGGDTYFCNSTSNCATIGGTAVKVGAKGGTGGGATGGAGGLASAGYGSTKYNGGTGANDGGSGGGGGGAGGPNGAGGNGSSSTGGTGGNGSGGAGGTVGNPGTAGQEWDASHGSGGGGGGAAAGGAYGGGGGGFIAFGSGAAGIIVITYTADRLILTGNVQFRGNLAITGALSKGSGTFVIDHPLDPRNKLLYHSFVESADAKNMYAGIVELNGQGEATIELPSYFEALNGEYRYQFFPLFKAMPNLFVKQEVVKNTFVIAGGTPFGQVSWQISGVRHDPYIIANPIVVEVEKTESTEVKKGECLFEELCNN